MNVLPLPGIPFSTLSARPAGQFFPSPPVALFSPTRIRPPAALATPTPTPTARHVSQQKLHSVAKCYRSFKDGATDL